MSQAIEKQPIETTETKFLKRVINDVNTDDTEKAELISDHYADREFNIVAIFIIVIFILLCITSDSCNKLKISRYSQPEVKQLNP